MLADIVAATSVEWPSLRVLRASAAPTAPRLAAELEGRFAVPFISAYTMTEAPGEIASQDPFGARTPGTVGAPTISEVSVEGGEILIRGPNVAVSSGDEWLRTGDLGNIANDGTLTISGRKDDLINQGGLKVAPGDVEAAVLRHPAIAAAVAFPIPHASLGNTIGLAVVACEGAIVDRAMVRRVVMAGLPRHQWPASIVVCDAIPTNARGKVARRSLASALGLEASERGRFP